MSVSIETPVENHRRYCHSSSFDDPWNWPGDVRVCGHGRIQVAYEVLGSTSCDWRDLSPVFNPILWRRARAALRKELE